MVANHYRSTNPMKSSLLFGAVAAFVCFAPGAIALSPSEVEQGAKAVSVEMLTGEGSGVIIHRQGDLYTVITNRHVVCTIKKLCTDRDVHTSYRLKTSDAQVYQVAKSDIKLLKDSTGKPLDLATVQFKSNHTYPVAHVADPDSLKVDDAVYTAGFPVGRGWLLGTGQTQAVVNRRLVGDKGGYTIIYDAETLPGMSGGGVFDNNGRLVAIHGSGDRFTENTQSEAVRSGKINIVKELVGNKIGFNRGIPIRWVVQGLAELGLLLGGIQPLEQTGADKAATTADEFFISGFNKFVDPGEEFQVGRREALAQLSQAVFLNPRYTVAYLVRAIVKHQLNDPQEALADLNQAISLNPRYTFAYFLRAWIKHQLNDSQEALADYNQTIFLDPNVAEAYSNRGLLKYEKLNDLQGALADLNQAISLDPKLALAYSNRGLLKSAKLNDPQGALADLNQAISLDPKLAVAYSNLGLLKSAKLNDPQGALTDFNQAISLDPNLALAYIGRGMLKAYFINDFQGASSDLNQALSIDPKLAEAYFSRGFLKKDKLNDPQGALADFNQAISLNPKFAEAYIGRGFLKKDKLMGDRLR
jgi:tetratricopeptide (TPR) repeat protein